MSEILSEFEAVSDDEASFPEKNTDKTATDAEVLTEVSTIREEKEEVISDKLTQLLTNLPDDAETKFLITRLSDKNLSGSFRLKCDHNEECDAVYWNGETEPSELYKQIKKINGGGVYRIRTHNNRGFVKDGTWTATLSDPIEHSEKEKFIAKQKEAEAKAKETPPAPVPVFIPPPQPAAAAAPVFDRKKFLSELIEEKKLEAEIGKLFSPPAAASPTEPTAATFPPAKPSRMEFLIELFKASDDKEQKTRMMNAILGAENQSAAVENSWYESLFKVGAEMIANNPALQAQIGQVVAGFLNLGTAIITSKVAPGAAAVPAVYPATAPAAPAAPPPIDLASLKQDRNDAPAAQEAENAPQVQLQPITPLAPVVPLIKIGE